MHVKTKMLRESVDVKKEEAKGITLNVEMNNLNNREYYYYYYY